MSGTGSGGVTRLSVAAHLEERLAATLNETSHEVSRMECLDAEQRSEIYAILEALTSDSQQHSALIQMLKSRRQEGISDA